MKKKTVRKVKKKVVKKAKKKAVRKKAVRRRSIGADISFIQSQDGSGVVSESFSLLEKAIGDYQKGEMLARSSEKVMERAGKINDAVGLLQGSYSNKKAKELNDMGIRNSLYSKDRNIGTSKDPITSLFIIEDYQQYTYARIVQSGLDLMDNIISDPVRMALKKPYEFEIEGATDAQVDKVRKRFQELKVYPKIFDLLVKSRLSSLGSVLLPLFDSKEGEESKSKGSLPKAESFLGSRIENISVVPDYAFWFLGDSAINSVWELDYGMPRRYWVGGKEVDKSRIYHCVNQYDSLVQRGISILGQNLTACKGLAIMEQSLTYQLLQAHFKLYKYPNDIVETMGSDQTVLTKHREAVSVIKSQSKSADFIIMPNDYDLIFRDINFSTGYKDVSEFLYDYLAGSSRKASASIKGRAVGEIASGDRILQEQRDFIKSSIQNEHIIPALSFLMKFILAEEEVGLKDHNFEIVPAPIYEESEKEKLEVEEIRERVRQQKQLNDEFDLGDTEEEEGIPVA